MVSCELLRALELHVTERRAPAAAPSAPAAPAPAPSAAAPAPAALLLLLLLLLNLPLHLPLHLAPRSVRLAGSRSRQLAQPAHVDLPAARPRPAPRESP